jgi:hypothetical protein
MRKLKWILLATVLAVVGLVGGLTRVARHQKLGSGSADKDAGAVTQPVTLAETDAGTAVAQQAQDPREVSSGSDARVLPLPPSAPNDVVFGAILVSFEGVQGAPNRPRSKEAAREMALRLLAVAQTNFEEAAKQGDPGSTANAGSIRRGILEPAIEYALFTLDKGSVYPEPVETPRGFWIMRRIR